MKITYTIDNSSPVLNIFKSENNKVVISWKNEPSNMAVLELSSEGIKEYIQSPSKLMSEANNIYIKLDKENNLEQPVFKMIETYHTKMGGMEFIKYKLKQVIGQIYIPFKDSSFEEYTLRINVKEEDVSKLLQFVPSATQVENNEQSFKQFYFASSPVLKVINTSSVGDWTKIKVQLVLNNADLAKANVRIFAKSSSGYIANREVYTDANGQAEFKVLPYGLEQGEIMKTEFGFKYYSNIVSKDVVA